MKKRLSFFTVSTLTLFSLLASLCPIQAQNSCIVNITGDFESRCVVTMEKPNPFEENEGDLIACKGNTVVYSALTNTGHDPVVSWTWTVTGASSWTANRSLHCQSGNINQRQPYQG